VSGGTELVGLARYGRSSITVAEAEMFSNEMAREQIADRMRNAEGARIARGSRRRRAQVPSDEGARTTRSSLLAALIPGRRHAAGSVS
jgi:hypothetical protein